MEEADAVANEGLEMKNRQINDTKGSARSDKRSQEQEWKHREIDGLSIEEQRMDGSREKARTGDKFVDKQEKNSGIIGQNAHVYRRSPCFYHQQ